MVEFTLSMTLLIPLFLGAWAFGYTFYQYAKLEDAVRAGARYASTINYDSATTTPSNTFLTAVQDMTAYGDPSGSTTTPVVSGLTPSNVTLTVTFTNGAPSAMTVAITNFKLPTYMGSFKLSGKPYVWFPYLGYWSPP